MYTKVYNGFDQGLLQGSDRLLSAAGQCPFQLIKDKDVLNGKCPKCRKSMVQCDEQKQHLNLKGLTDLTYYKKGKILDHASVAGALLMICT